MPLSKLFFEAYSYRANHNNNLDFDKFIKSKLKYSELISELYIKNNYEFLELTTIIQNNK